VSAICGVVGLDGRPWSETDLDGVVRVLAPLGRDGGGRWAGTAGRTGVAVAAALRRSTPEDGADRQPAHSRDGALVLVGDLRLDNRDELAGALRLSDDASVPDSAIVLAGYERWGETMLERIVGEFALAIVDRRRGGTLVARDHVGGRSLVVHERAGVVAFATTALALTGLQGVGHALDVRRAAEVLALVFDSGRTFVEGVRFVAPATALWIDAAGVRRWTWWTADPHDIRDLGSPAAHERELRDAFDRAVRARLRSAGAVGAMTSGGLDSSSASATAARLLAPGRLRTYTSAPPPGWRGPGRPNWDADESALVRKLAELHPNIAPTFVHQPPGQRLFDRDEELWAAGSGLGRNPCNLLWYRAICERAAADGVTTLLSGAGGNMFFSADGPGWLPMLLRRGRVAAAVREAAALGAASGAGAPRVLVRGGVHPLLPVRVRALVRTVRRRDTELQEWIAATALRPEISADLDLPALVPALDERRSTDRRRIALSTVMAGSGQAENRAARAALTGVEERDPTIDRRVLEVAMRQPESVRRHDGITRAVARGAMADRLPAEIVHRTRRGEQLPDWLDVMTAARSELTGELAALRDHATSRELIDCDRLARLVDRWPDRSARADPAVLRDYRVVLLRALYISRYLRWFEDRATANAAAASGRVQ
jgi:asparagine synthase (glutamine-hydrolysing)